MIKYEVLIKRLQNDIKNLQNINKNLTNQNKFLINELIKYDNFEQMPIESQRHIDSHTDKHNIDINTESYIDIGTSSVLYQRIQEIPNKFNSQPKSHITQYNKLYTCNTCNTKYNSYDGCGGECYIGHCNYFPRYYE